MGGSNEITPPEGASAARERLAAERTATRERLVALGTEFDGIVAGSEGANADDEHDPEGSTIAFERANVDALLAQARTDLEQLARAEQRVDDGTYWTCTVCGSPIDPERLAARPVAVTCIECASRIG